MGAVADFVSDVVDTVGDVVEAVGDVAEDVVQVAGDAVEDVAQTVGDVVEGALEDPIGTMASVAAIATQQYYLLPAISAGKVVANGGDLDDALKAAAITYAAGQAGDWASGEVNAALNYGTDLGSAQTAMLAAQDAGMGMGTTLGGAAGSATGAATGALLSGGDVGQAVLGGLAGYGANLTLNAAGQVINEFGDVIANSIDELTSETYGDQPGDFPTTPEELAAADLELGGIPSPSMIGDQPGDYDTTPEEVAASEQTLASMPGLDAATTEAPIADQPGDYDTTPQEVAASEETLASMPGLDAVTTEAPIADQPGDYDTTPAEVAASEETLASMPGLDAVTAEAPIGDQPGDFPQTPEELAAADAELGNLPAAEQYADQPGDYDTTPQEVAASEEALSQIPDAATSAELNTKAVQDYFANQFKNNLLKNLLGGGTGTMALAGGLNSLGGSGTGGTISGSNISPILGGGGEGTAELPDPMQAFRNSPVEQTQEQPKTTMATAEELEFDPTTGLMKPKVTNPYAGLDAVNPILNAATGGTTTPTSSISLNSFGSESKNPILNPVYSDTLFPKQVSKIQLRNPLEAFSHADGGSIPGHNPEFYSEGGASMANRYVKGRGDGTSDSVPAMLASGEFVIPADVVSGLGNGDNDAGAKVLDEFLATIRKHKRAADARQLPPDSKGPLAYLTQAKKKVRK